MYNMSEDDLSILINNNNKYLGRLPESNPILSLNLTPDRVRELFTNLNIPEKVKIFGLRNAKNPWSYKTDSITEDATAVERGEAYMFRIRPIPPPKDFDGDIFTYELMDSDSFFEDLKEGLENKITDIVSLEPELNVRIGVLLPFLIASVYDHFLVIEKVCWMGDYILVTDEQLNSIKGIDTLS